MISKELCHQIILVVVLFLNRYKKLGICKD